MQKRGRWEEAEKRRLGRGREEMRARDEMLKRGGERRLQDVAESRRVCRRRRGGKQEKSRKWEVEKRGGLEERVIHFLFWYNSVCRCPASRVTVHCQFLHISS